MRKYLAILGAFCLGCIFPLSAKEKKSFSGKIQEFFDQTNIPANISEGDVFYDDVIGVNFLGGSGFVRTQVSDINPIHVSLPKLNVGCGGIDYTMGALNIVSKDEMKKALLNIAKNAGTHAFLLALETTSPLTAGVMSKVQHWSNQLNAININSCEIGSSLIEGIWPRSEEATQYICSQTG
ncbi:MAG: conjugal transfer protein TraH, partial [Chlamydiia bacterium]|nr:conjugal transfer protein TraH [Chlamydiia bacterium]